MVHLCRRASIQRKCEGAVHLFRSWTGHKYAEIDISAPAEALGRITRITWESSEDIVRGNTEQQAKETVLGVFRGYLGVDLTKKDRTRTEL